MWRRRHSNIIYNIDDVKFNQFESNGQGYEARMPKKAIREEFLAWSKGGWETERAVVGKHATLYKNQR